MTFVDEFLVPSTGSTPDYRPPTSYPATVSSTKKQFILDSGRSVTSSLVAEEELKELNKELGKAGVVIEVQQFGDPTEKDDNQFKDKKLNDLLKMSFDDVGFQYSSDFSHSLIYIFMNKDVLQ